MTLTPEIAAVNMYGHLVAYLGKIQGQFLLFLNQFWCPRSSVDRAPASGAGSVGSIPIGGAILFAQQVFLTSNPII